MKRKFMGGKDNWSNWLFDADGIGAMITWAVLEGILWVSVLIFG